jgi:sigma-B regulation protein RsbU (phosphoserine phosphatase)
VTDTLDLDAFATPEGDERPGTMSDRQLLTTLFALGREVASVLDLDELLAKLPALIARIVDFHAFAIYLLDEKRGDLRIACSQGYPDHQRSRRVSLNEGLVGAAVTAARPLLANDVTKDSRYIEAVPGTRSEVVIPLRRKGKAIGALNLLSRNIGEFSPAEVETLRNFAATLAVAIENARLFESERKYSDTLETLADIGRDLSSILDLSELLHHVAKSIKRVVGYRSFGIMLLADDGVTLELKHAVRLDEEGLAKRTKIGEGLVGYSAQHKTPVLVPDVTTDPRYIKVLEDVRSELVVPLLLKDRCIGVFDLESPEVGAFNEGHVELLTPLAASAAVAIENARLYDEIRHSQERLEKELRFAQRVQQALFPVALPKRLKGLDVAWRFEPARELGGDLYDFLSADANTLTVVVGDVSGKGVPAALYSAFAGELIRSRTYRRRFTTERSMPAEILASINRILNERQLHEYYCTLCYALFDLKRRFVTMANSGLPYPIRCSGDECGPIELPGVPLGSFPEIVYDEVRVELHPGDVFVFCSDGISEAMNEESAEFTSDRLIDVIRRTRDLPAQAMVDAVFSEVGTFCGRAEQNDDRTAVVVKLADTY